MIKLFKNTLKGSSLLLIFMLFEGCGGINRVGVPEHSSTTLYYKYKCKSDQDCKHGEVRWDADVPLAGVFISKSSHRSKFVDIIDNPTKETLMLAIEKNHNYGENSKRWNFNYKFIRDMVKSSDFRNMTQADKDEIALYVLKMNPAKPIVMWIVPTAPDVCVKYKPSHIQYLPHAPEELVEYVIKEDPLNFQYIQRPSEDLKIKAVNANPKSLLYIYEPSLELVMDTLKKDSTNVQYLDYPSQEIQNYVMKVNPLNFQYIQRPSESTQKEAIDANQNNIKYLKNPSSELQMYIAEYYPTEFENIDNPTPEAALVSFVKMNDYNAVRKIGDLFYNKENPTNDDYEVAFSMYKLCVVNANDDVAKYYLADLYRHGQGTEKDLQKAADLTYSVTKHQSKDYSEFIYKAGFYYDSLTSVSHYHDEGLFGFKKSQKARHVYYKKMYEVYPHMADVMKIGLKKTMDNVCKIDPDACKQ
ncbi:MAG: hypothetical protein U9N59_05960 [Campylobacterota bacterium]|nr:hypothetical protein [Campylobacterota bacterium]